MAAASGMARVGSNLFVVSDDDHRLVVVDGCGEVELRAFADGLPQQGPTARKRLKRDIEAVAARDGVLVGLGSGSTPRRCWGFAWRLTEGGDLAGDAEPLVLSGLYGELAARIPDLNIEGAVFVDEQLLLLQRGNGAAGVNAVIRLAWRGSAAATLSPEAIDDVELHDLGAARGVPLAFTDAARAGDRVLFTAVAEEGESTYHDGACVGAVVGVLGGEAWPLDPTLKVEGIEVAPNQPAGDEILLVVDDDQPGSPSRLYAAQFARGLQRA